MSTKYNTLKRLEELTRPVPFALASTLLLGIGALVGPPLATWFGEAVPSKTLVRLLAVSVLGLVVSLTYIVLLRLKSEVQEDERKRKKISSWDRELFSKHVAHFQDGPFRFLREQDMGAPFHYDSITPFFSYVDTWKGPAFEFVDQELEARRLAFDQAIRAFIASVVVNTYADGHIVSMELHDCEEDPEVLKERDMMNTLGHAAADAFEELVRFGRTKIGVDE